MCFYAILSCWCTKTGHLSTEEPRTDAAGVKYYSGFDRFSSRPMKSRSLAFFHPFFHRFIDFFTYFSNIFQHSKNSAPTNLHYGS